MAFAAVFVLVLQSVAGAFAGPSAQLDMFGNPLCINGEEHSGNDRGSHKQMPNCCALGCGGFSPAAGTAAPDDAASLAMRQPIVLDVLFADFGDEISSIRVHAPGNPRAPPLAT